MNPLRVDSLESAFLAFGAGFLAAVLVTIFLHYSANSLNSLAGKVAGTAAA
jgi:hypothetical protein